jgi:hypothetical protein
MATVSPLISSAYSSYRSSPPSTSTVTNGAKSQHPPSPAAVARIERERRQKISETASNGKTSETKETLPSSQDGDNNQARNKGRNTLRGPAAVATWAILDSNPFLPSSSLAGKSRQRESQHPPRFAGEYVNNLNEHVRLENLQVPSSISEYVEKLGCNNSQNNLQVPRFAGCWNRQTLSTLSQSGVRTKIGIFAEFCIDPRNYVRRLPAYRGDRQRDADCHD